MQNCIIIWDLGSHWQNPVSDYWVVVSVSNYQKNQVGIIQNSGLPVKYKHILMERNLERDV